MLKQEEFMSLGKIATEIGSVTFSRSVQTGEVWIEVEGPSGHENPMSIMLKLTKEEAEKLDGQ